MRTFLFAIGCALGGVASLGAQPPSDTTPARATVTPRVCALAGCYQLSVGPWRGAPPGGPNLPSQQPPTRARLDTLALPQPFQDDGFVVEPVRVSPYGHWPAGWSVAGDTVRLWWSTGFTGVSLRLGAHGDTLTGRAVTFHDAHRIGEPPDPEAPVRAVRIRSSACSHVPSPRPSPH